MKRKEEDKVLPYLLSPYNDFSIYYILNM